MDLRIARILLQRCAICTVVLLASSARAQTPHDASATTIVQQTQPPAPSGPTAPSQPVAPPQEGATPSPGGQAPPTTGPAPLPEITITPPKVTPTPAPKRAAAPPTAPPQPQPTQPTPESAAAEAARALSQKMQAFDTARDDNLLPKIGTSSYGITHDAIEALPQGINTPFDKVLLQAPGVSQDSAASGNIHVRNEHANLQYRINGIILPEGVIGFGSILETTFIGKMALITGALPAQYGLRTSGLVDIQTRSGAAAPGGTIGIYGGSRETVTPYFEYGGVAGQTDYFFTGRYFTSGAGIENPAPTLNPIHDDTWQGKFFGYTSTLLDDTTRISSITGFSSNHYQIPNRTGLTPMFTAFGISDFDSTLLNERQVEQNFYNVLAVQKKAADLDLQLAFFTRYSSIHFSPDPVGDLLFNGVASNVTRNSLLNGVQGDAAYRINERHTLRGGFYVSGEKTDLTNASTVLPLDDAGNPIDAPFEVVDEHTKVGWLVGTYIQDEWKITERLILNLGLRFDQMSQFVDANQFSPRIGLEYKPFSVTTLHAGYARYFTPPPQVVASPSNISAFLNTTAAPPCQPGPGCNDPVLPERAHYFDAGIVQKVLPGLEVSFDAYRKIARDLLDDGQFGAALVLNGFNYEKAENIGKELSVKYEAGGLRAYGNIAWAKQMGINIISNQYLLDPAHLAFAADNYIFTDHTQKITASAGLSYLWEGTRFSTDMIYGSGLRNGFANTTHLPGYVQVNVGVSREFNWLDVPDAKPATLRFDVVNVFDHVYELRDGTGIGVFAPQFGPRRGYFIGLSQKF
jgi:outer membrane receptor protein involved in Fe transport